MIVEKLKHIVANEKFENAEEDEEVGAFTAPAIPENMTQISELLGESLPEDFMELYAFSDGQSDGNGIFFGDGLVTTEKMMRELRFAKSNAKPENPHVENPASSKQVLDKIVAHYLTLTPKKRFLAKPRWEKLEFDVSPNSLGGPYFYELGKSENEREIVETTDAFKQESFALAREIYELEKASYHWDSLNFTVLPNGHYDVKREIYDFTSDMTSTPENAIKRDYFNPKWLPVFEDFGGNFIGLDFDPDMAGVKGQVIIYGRDEENMVVLADSLSGLFDKIIAWQASPETNEALENEFHIHDTLRELLKA